MDQNVGAFEKNIMKKFSTRDALLLFLGLLPIPLIIVGPVWWFFPNKDLGLGLGRGFVGYVVLILLSNTILTLGIIFGGVLDQSLKRMWGQFLESRKARRSRRRGSCGS